MTLKEESKEQKREIEELRRMVESLLKREQPTNTNENSPLLEMLQVNETIIQDIDKVLHGMINKIG